MLERLVIKKGAFLDVSGGEVRLRCTASLAGRRAPRALVSHAVYAAALLAVRACAHPVLCIKPNPSCISFIPPCSPRAAAA